MVYDLHCLGHMGMCIAYLQFFIGIWWLKFENLFWFLFYFFLWDLKFVQITIKEIIGFCLWIRFVILISWTMFIICLNFFFFLVFRSLWHLKMNDSLSTLFGKRTFPMISNSSQLIKVNYKICLYNVTN